ncbi:hypothetical protein F5887DRAFT_991566 [Amanita rubescens]|nr:hypothetical protein F5887DRAFT_991566 [Amanita rubescens]
MPIQYWKALNLDKRETLGKEPWGEFSDIMLSGTPESLVSQLLGDWSGNRIVICSDYAFSFPDGLLTPREMDEVEDMYLEDGEMEYDDDDPAPTLYAFAEESYKVVVVPVKIPTTSKGVKYYLRNLDKKQYVRSDVVVKECPDGVKEKGGESGLGHVVVIMACLTDEEEEIGGEKVGNGSWAGDRLEITEAESRSESGGWRDVSEQVVERLKRIWGRGPD